MGIQEKLANLSDDNWEQRLDAIQPNDLQSDADWKLLFKTLSELGQKHYAITNTPKGPQLTRHEAIARTTRRLFDRYRSDKQWDPFFNEYVPSPKLDGIDDTNRAEKLSALEPADLQSMYDWRTFFGEMKNLKQQYQQTVPENRALRLKWYQVAAKMYPHFRMPESQKKAVASRTRGILDALKRNNEFQTAIYNHALYPERKKESVQTIGRLLAAEMSKFHKYENFEIGFFEDENSSVVGRAPSGNTNKIELNQARLKNKSTYGLLETIYHEMTHNTQSNYNFAIGPRSDVESFYDMDYRHILEDSSSTYLSIDTATKIFEQANGAPLNEEEKEKIRKAYMCQPDEAESYYAGFLMSMAIENVMRKKGLVEDKPSPKVLEKIGENRDSLLAALGESVVPVASEPQWIFGRTTKEMGYVAAAKIAYKRYQSTRDTGEIAKIGTALTQAVQSGEFLAGSPQPVVETLRFLSQIKGENPTLFNTPAMKQITQSVIRFCENSPFKPLKTVVSPEIKGLRAPMNLSKRSLTSAGGR